MRSAMFDGRILPDEPYAEKLVTLRRGRKPPPEGEDARGRFVRLVTKRAKAALTELRLIGNPREPRLQLVSAGDRGIPPLLAFLVLRAAPPCCPPIRCKLPWEIGFLDAESFPLSCLNQLS